ncbi:MAG: TIGR03016 family PEP-CTERM system-associated outer membrane protein, partial [Thiotrichaceae bacterium]|nr:TIGR03016 family PEP-CTERM system-associated outer membrane protein [Thiotrichaceae bacterium]
MAITINKKAVYILSLTMLASLNGFAKAEVNKFNPSISVGMTYTDNVDLTHTNKDSDLVLRVTPGLGTGITTEGSRLRTQLNYSVSGLSYESNSSSNDFYHNLSSSATAEIVKNAIFLDGFANTRQVLLDQNTSASSDNISGSDNLTNTYTYGLTASWKKNWERYATSDISYGYDEVKLSGGEDSTGNQINFHLANGPKFTQYFWDLNYNYNETRYDSDSPDTTTKIAYVTLGYHYSRLLDLRIRLGQEDYDDTVDDGFGWTIGGNWHPSPRTSLDASWGERAFGRTAFLDFSHRRKRITWQLNYSDEITNSR